MSKARASASTSRLRVRGSSPSARVRSPRRGLKAAALLLGALLLSAAIAAPSSALAEQVCDTSHASLSAPSTRFADNGDGTVTDRESGLMWLQCSIGQRWTNSTCEGEPTFHDWTTAQAAAAATNRSGNQFFSDWRLPALREMATITERQCRNPRINLSVFPNTAAVAHWTSTPRPGTALSTAAFTLSFGDEGIEYQPLEQRHAVRLVRSAK